MTDSNFISDLKNEQFLGLYLDEVIYPKVFCEKSKLFERIHDKTLQKKGVDIIYHDSLKSWNIDEKAQLDYLNGSLPTFAFEISYMLNGQHKKGWLFDEEKETEAYFLITKIQVQKDTIQSGIKSLSLTSIHRHKLIQYLNSVGLTKKRIDEYESIIRRQKGDKKKFALNELNKFREGNMQISLFKHEQPINIILKLDFLEKKGIAKKLL